MDVILLSWSNFNLTFAKNFKGSNVMGKNIIEWVGIGGIFFGIIRTITLCIHFNWWWLLGIALAYFIVSGLLSVIFRGFSSVVLSLSGVIGIPIIWWLGGLF